MEEEEAIPTTNEAVRPSGEAVGAASETVIQSLVNILEEILSYSEFRNSFRKQFSNLSRRIKLLGPLIEELRESKEAIPDEALPSVEEFKLGLDLARDLLKLGSEGSKIALVLETEKINQRFYQVTSHLENSLSIIPFNKLDISDEIKEQVELVHAQLKRAKETTTVLNSSDSDSELLQKDLLYIYNNPTSSIPDPTILKQLSSKLQLTTIPDLKQESLALHSLVLSSDGDPGEVVERMCGLLRKIKELVQSEEGIMEGSCSSWSSCSDSGRKGPVIPDDFRCPISLEMMKDPVIVSTGQTYERECIEKWIQSGHNTCPKTQLKLPNSSLTPNFVLRSLISQWCESNGLDPPKPPPHHLTVHNLCTASEHSRVLSLLHSLSSLNADEQRNSAAELRLLAKRNAENRACIAEAGAIPLLVSLLSVLDLKTQEHAVTCLLNLSIYEENKGRIIASGSVPGIVHVLKRGNTDARENAAATLFSLSVIDENKVTIGASGAIPPLVSLLSNGTQRGKKDAATALFNLCIYQGNKGKAVRAGIVPILMELLMEKNSGMVDEALAILAILSSHNEGKLAIGAAKAVPILVQQVKDGSPRNKENAAAVLVHLCNGDFIMEVSELGVVEVLEELKNSGTDRGKRKAVLLLERIGRFLDMQKEVESQISMGS